MESLRWNQRKSREGPTLFGAEEIGTTLKYLYFSEEEQTVAHPIVQGNYVKGSFKYSLPWLWLGVLLRRRSVQAWEAKDAYSGANWPDWGLCNKQPSKQQTNW